MTSRRTTVTAPRPGRAAAYLGSGGPGGGVGLGGITIGLGGGGVDLGGIAIGPGDGSPGGGVAGFRGSRKYLELIKV